MKFVQATKVVKKSFKRLLNRRKFQKSMDYNIKHRDESETNISKVHGKGLEIVTPFSQNFGGKLFRKLFMNFKMFLVPVI